ncbi:MAG: adaptor protein MecA [Oscillospiraceae bacterium]|nr:adaptor protein MecA [Oscillospiraceae bacterium]
MNIVYIRSGVYVLTAQRSEFDTYYIMEEHAKNALCSALHLYSLPKNTVIELFDGADSIIIFARIPPSYYIFEDFEDVIAACENCSAENAALYYYDGEYILSVSLPDTVLDEFAQKADAPYGFDGFLNEHGRLLIPSDAVNFVKNTF